MRSESSKKGKIIFKDLSYKITGICFKVQNKLGRFCKEKQYPDELREEFLKEKLSHKKEVFLHKAIKSKVHGNRVDFIIEDKIIIDVKAKRFIT